MLTGGDLASPKSSFSRDKARWSKQARRSSFTFIESAMGAFNTLTGFPTLGNRLPSPRKGLRLQCAEVLSGTFSSRHEGTNKGTLRVQFGVPLVDLPHRHKVLSK